MSLIMVSIICNTYNQEGYIKDALESFVSQKTNFNYEVLIHDDASTDGTSDIILSYKEKYPNIIKPIFQKENQYSKGINISNRFQYPRALGKYIAFCEGDDYFTDPYKLQIQFDILESHPDIDICSHVAEQVLPFNKKRISLIIPSKHEKVLSCEDVILGGGGFVSTNSLMFRKELFFNRPEFRQYLSLDYTLQIHGSLKGGMYFIPKIMSAYRYSSKNSWTEAMKTNPQKRIELNNKIINMLKILNRETHFIYQDVINHRIELYRIDELCYKHDYKLIKKYPYKSIYKKMSIKNKFIINLHIYMPFIFTIKECLFNKFKG